MYSCSFSSFFSRDFGALLIEGQNPSSATAFHRRFSRQQYLVHDLEFHNACCRQADRCDLFRERRLSNNCFRYFPPFWGMFLTLSMFLQCMINLLEVLCICTVLAHLAVFFFLWQFACTVHSQPQNSVFLCFFYENLHVLFIHNRTS